MVSSCLWRKFGTALQVHNLTSLRKCHLAAFFLFLRIDLHAGFN